MDTKKYTDTQLAIRAFGYGAFTGFVGLILMVILSLGDNVLMANLASGLSVPLGVTLGIYSGGGQGSIAKPWVVFLAACIGMILFMLLLSALGTIQGINILLLGALAILFSTIPALWTFKHSGRSV